MIMSLIELGQYLRNVRESLGYSTYDVNKLCNISPSYLSLFETGKRKPSAIILKKLAPIYNLNYLDLYEKAGYIELAEKERLEQNNNISHKFYMTPVYGRIAAGIPNWAEECIEGRIPIDPELFGIIDPEEHFFLQVNGESMNKIIKNGAYALQDTVENGEIAVVLVNGYEATLKKFSKQGDLIILEPMSNDESYQVQIYNKETIIKILGKYVGKFEINK